MSATLEWIVIGVLAVICIGLVYCIHVVDRIGRK